MDLKQAFGIALRRYRHFRGLTQEDFALVSSRTYISMLERGEKSPTLEKIDALAEELRIDPCTLVTLALALKLDRAPDEILRTVEAELELLESSS
ncbi:MAG: XRE family transcriptional regulator [Oceanococcus sp.]|nr:MAG: XRE family transcriptional regulator [Oceanococcus sp.]